MSIIGPLQLYHLVHYRRLVMRRWGPTCRATAAFMAMYRAGWWLIEQFKSVPIRRALINEVQGFANNRWVHWIG